MAGLCSNKAPQTVTAAGEDFEDFEFDDEFDDEFDAGAVAGEVQALAVVLE
jgi:hypothetical protein